MLNPVNPDPPPWNRRTVLRQRWDELAYFHWAYPVEEVQALLPPGLRVDEFGGSAWVGLIPFHMRRVQLGPTPAVPYFGDFVEINVRTYVIDGSGRRAVWFFSLDVPRAVVVGVARSLFSLPYCFGPSSHKRQGSTHIYSTRRLWPRPDPGVRPQCRIEFTHGEPMGAADIGPLEHFLSARWGLVADRRGQLAYGAVDHARWPLYRIVNSAVSQTLIETTGLSSPRGEPHSMYSPGVDVRIGWFEPSARSQDFLRPTSRMEPK